MGIENNSFLIDKLARRGYIAGPEIVNMLLHRVTQIQMGFSTLTRLRCCTAHCIDVEGVKLKPRGKGRSTS